MLLGFALAHRAVADVAHDERAAHDQMAAALIAQAELIPGPPALPSSSARAAGQDATRRRAAPGVRTPTPNNATAVPVALTRVLDAAITAAASQARAQGAKARAIAGRLRRIRP